MQNPCTKGCDAAGKAIDVSLTQGGAICKECGKFFPYDGSEKTWAKAYSGEWRRERPRPPAAPRPGAVGRARDQQAGLLQATGEGESRQEISEGDMCFVLSDPDFLSDVRAQPRAPSGILSKSPWAFLDKAETPAERQQLIYARQHKMRDAHFRDQDRAEELAESRNYWKAAARRNLEAGLAAVDRSFVQGCVAGAVVGVMAIVALWLLGPFLA